MNTCAMCQSPEIIHPTFCYCSPCANANERELIKAQQAALWAAQAAFGVQPAAPFGVLSIPAEPVHKTIGFIPVEHVPSVKLRIGFVPTPFGKGKHLEKIGFKA